MITFSLKKCRSSSWLLTPMGDSVVQHLCVFVHEFVHVCASSLQYSQQEPSLLKKVHNIKGEWDFLSVWIKVVSICGCSALVCVCVWWKSGVYPYASPCHLLYVGCWAWQTWECESFDHDSCMEKQITFHCCDDRKAHSGWQISAENLISSSFHWQMLA